MTGEDVAGALEEVARLLELQGENPFKIRAYINAARALENYPGDLADMARKGQLDSIEGVGKAIAAKIATLLETGEMPILTDLRRHFPPGLQELFEVQGLGPKKIKALYDKLGVDSVDALRQACEDGRVAELPGFGAKTTQRILAAIESRDSYAGQYLPASYEGLVSETIEQLLQHPAVSQASFAGSYRRGKEIIRDLDLVVASSRPDEVTADFVALPWVTEVLLSGPTKTSVRFEGGIQCDLRVVTAEEYPCALVYFTGSKEHNVKLRQLAIQKGWSLNEYRFSAAADAESPARAVPEVREEAGVYDALGLDYIAPELREDRGEFEAAADGTLPRLVEWMNLRGAFHNHTVASDGHDSLEVMADTAQDMGLQYLGIADHSKSSVQAHGLDESRLLAQVEEIARLNATYQPDQFRLFAGVECDILRDGTLDFSDEILARLDYVVASVHSVFGLDSATMTKRVIHAISNPHVTMLGHLTGRLLLSREPYALDIPAVIDAAADTGTIIELNCNPYRLEMDWRWWRHARDKGVKTSLNPDAHRADGLGYLRYGVRAARKGWLRREDVVNCLPLGGIEKALQAKRAKRV